MTAFWLWLCVGVPAAGAAAVLACGRRHGAAAATLAALLGVVPAAVLLAAAAGGTTGHSGGRWLGGAGLEVGLRLDGLSAAMAGLVAVVGAAVVVYATGYFAEHPRAPSALAGLLAFLAAMQALVLADGFLALLIAWEVVGALSMRLIAFSREREDAPAGAVRAFLTTRTADTGLYLAVLALYAASGSLAFTSDRPSGALGALVGGGLVLAAMGKSAQVPLQSWLAGAMAGPTPVSALLHSATMVAAGVYLVVRNDALLEGWPLELAGWVGALTAVVGALIALSERDLKRVLAGSTSSQLGLMFVGAAAGGPAVAVFHLVAHAAGKATMFLATGVFQHERDSTDLERLRGVRRTEPVAFWAFAAGAASIASVPPLAAFWSKDAIVTSVEGSPVRLALVLAAAAGSAAYMLRPVLVLADWPARQPASPEHVPASGGSRRMLGVLVVLAAAGPLVGLLGGPLADLLDAPSPGTTVAGVAASLAALGLGVAVVLRPTLLSAIGRFGGALGRGLRGAADAAAAAARAGAGGLGRLDQRVAVRGPDLAARGVLTLGRGTDRGDRRVVDAAVDGVGQAGLGLAAMSERTERSGIDAAVDAIARAVGHGGDEVRKLQTGRLHEYLRDAVLGAAAIAVLLVLTALT